MMKEEIFPQEVKLQKLPSEEHQRCKEKILENLLKKEDNYKTMLPVFL